MAGLIANFEGGRLGSKETRRVPIEQRITTFARISIYHVEYNTGTTLARPAVLVPAVK